MADLDKTGISTGEAIEATDITKLYDALTGDTVYDNTPTLLGNIKEYAANLAYDGSAWSKTDIKNTTGGTFTITQPESYYFLLTFSGYTVPDNSKIFMTDGQLTSSGITTDHGNPIIFSPHKNSSTELYIYMYEYNGTAIANFSGEDLEFKLRLLFYP